LTEFESVLDDGGMIAGADDVNGNTFMPVHSDHGTDHDSVLTDFEDGLTNVSSPMAVEDALRVGSLLTEVEEDMLVLKR